MEAMDAKLRKEYQKLIRTALSGREIEEIIVHAHPHLDERVACRLLRDCGEYLFPGVSQAREVRQVVSEKDAFWSYLKQGKLLVGQGGGLLDEHDADRTREGNISASWLVTDLLGVTGRTDVTARFLEAVNLEDATAQAPCSMHLAYEVKLMERLAPYVAEGSFNIDWWVETAIDAHRQWEKVEHPKVAVSPRLASRLKDNLMEMFHQKDPDERDNALRHLIHKVVDKKFAKSAMPFGVAYTQFLVYSTMGEEVAMRWAFQALRAEVQQQWYFEQALMMFETAEKHGNGSKAFAVELEDAEGNIVCDPSGQRHRMAFVSFHNPEAARAALSRRGYAAIVVVQRNDAGQTQIFFNRSYYSFPEEISSWLAGELISREPDRWVAPFDTLILNGSITYPHVPGSELSNEEILLLVAESFRRHWK